MVPAFVKRMEPFFTLRNKLPLQIVQIILIIAVISLSGARLLLPDRPPGRSTTMGLGMVNHFYGSRYLFLIFLGRQISHYHFLRNPFRTCQPLPTLEKPQGLFHPQRYGSRLLGRCCFHDDSRKCECLYRNKLCPWLGCVCTGRHS